MDGYLPLGVAARHLNVSDTYLRRLVDRGEVAAVRDALGRRYLAPSEVQRIRVLRAARRQHQEATAR